MKSRRQLLSILFLLFIFLMVFGGDNTSFAKSKSKKTKKKNSTINLTLNVSIRLFKGDSTYIDVGGKSKIRKVKFISKNPKIASVNKNGYIKAKGCGKTFVFACIEDNKSVRRLKIKVVVEKSSYMSRKCGGKGVTLKGDRRIKVHTHMYTGESVLISATSKTPGAKCRLYSSKSDVARIINGRLIARKKGYTTVLAVAKSGEKSAKIKLKVRVSEKPVYTVTEGMKDSWFIGSAMAGHSIGVGLEMYCRYQYNGFLGNTLHIVSGSYGVNNDMVPVSSESLHPIVFGAKRRLKDHVTALGIKKLFINYGMNDIGIFGPDTFALKYQSLIDELQAQNPETTVYIVASTPVLSPKGLLNNDCIASANAQMKAYAEKRDKVEYIDVFTPLLDGFGRLNPAYCSDGYCHMTFDGYKVYTDALKAFAEKQIRKEVDAADKAATEKEAKKLNKKTR